MANLDEEFNRLVEGVVIEEPISLDVVSLSDAELRTRLTAVRAALELRGETTDIRTERASELHYERALLIIESNIRGLE